MMRMLAKLNLREATRLRVARVLGVCAAACGVMILGALIWILAVPYPHALIDPSQGGPLRITDRSGTLLRSIPARDGRPGREHWASLSQVSPLLIATLITSEDRRFFEHHGVDWQGLLRAFWLDMRSGHLRYGGSTLTMQLARMVHSSGKSRTLLRKLYEVARAVQLERSLSKQQILEQYLNRAYYGHNAYGIEAASQRFFGKPAASLSDAEATFLAVLPRGPSYYDPLKHRARVLQRRDHLLALLRRANKLSPRQIAIAKAQPIVLHLQQPEFAAPHFVDWVVDGLTETLRARGGTVTTTLNLALQQTLEHRVAEHVSTMQHKRATQAGVVVLDAQSSEVLAMVGSRDFANEQLNITTWRRYPGSTLKPFVYATAIERGDHPASIAYDINRLPGSAFQIKGPWARERGPVRYREALAGSYNFAAVHVLERVGVPAVMQKLRAAGVGSLEGSSEDYGLRLALGSTKVRLVDLAAAYGFLVRAGRVKSPQAILRMTTHNAHASAPRATEHQVFSAEASFMVMDMLSDPQARHTMFGLESAADLAYPVAVKTGTSRGFTDTYAIFVTQEYTVAAWTGRFDGKPTEHLLGMSGAGPLARDALLIASSGMPLTLPAKPANVAKRDVCALSGMALGPYCSRSKQEYYLHGQKPLSTCTWHTAQGIRWPAQAQAWAHRHRHALVNQASLAN